MNCSFLLEISGVYVCFTFYTMEMIQFICLIIELKSILFIGCFFFFSLMSAYYIADGTDSSSFITPVCLPAFVRLTHKHTSEARERLTSRAPRLSSSTLSLISRLRLLIKPPGDFRRTVKEPPTVSPRAETESIKVMNPGPDF